MNKSWYGEAERLRIENTRLTEELAAVRKERDAEHQKADELAEIGAEYYGHHNPPDGAVCGCDLCVDVRAYRFADRLAARDAAIRKPLEEERDKMHAALRDVIGQCNGFATPEASVSFVCQAPDELRLMIPERDVRVKAQGRAEGLRGFIQILSMDAVDIGGRRFVEWKDVERLLDRLADAAKGEADV